MEYHIINMNLLRISIYVVISIVYQLDTVTSSCASNESCEANPNPCQNSGTCISSNGASRQSEDSCFTCECADGYSGQTCQDGHCEAHPNTCKNGGTCTSLTTSPYYECNCADGYYGDTCEDDHCKAYPNVCKNGGRCTSRTTSPFYECDCGGGYYGDTCQNDHCKAYPNVCKNGGRCTSLTTSPFYECDCADGYYGQTCQNDHCKAYPNVCKNGGRCTSRTTSPFYECDCADGYYGQTCQNDHCKAYPNVCKNGGRCTSLTTSPFYECDCADGYYGQTCQNDHCKAYPNVCKNGGRCTSLTTSPFYECDCADGYYGQTCQNDHCKAYPNVCKNGGRCTSRTTSPFYECDCADGYYGQTCQNDHCKAYPNTCKNGGTCTSRTTSPYYKCHCLEGYCGDTCEEPSSISGSVRGERYYFETYCDVINHSSAKQKCERKDGWLAEPRTAAISDVIKPMLSQSQYYSGLTKSGGGWKWRDGTGIEDYPNWSGSNSAECMVFNKEMKWNKRHCTGKNPLVCQFELIKIRSPENAIAIAGEAFEIFFNITALVDEIRVNVSHDGNFVTPISSITNNATNNFTIPNVDRGSEGIYEFIAYPIDGSFSFKSTTKVSVHVRAVIDKVAPTHIYSPVSNSPETVNCTFSGVPFPTKYGWYRDGVEIPDTGGGNVYQTKEGIYALLHVENAAASDTGDYVCQASNKVGTEISDTVAQSDPVQLAVYSSPRKLEIVEEKCHSKGVITVKWTPGNATERINHRFTVQPRSSTSAETINKTASSGRPVTFENLEPDTNYEVQVVVCPEYGCISQLTKSESITTGRNLPVTVSNPTISQNDNAMCLIQWNYTEALSSLNNVTGFNIIWESTIKEEILATVENKSGSYFVGSNMLRYRLLTSPNKNYYVTLSARNCAGNGSSRLARGDCSSEKDAPAFVPAPAFSTMQDNIRQSTRDVVINMVSDESNGTISCLFVLLYKEDQFISENVPRTLDQLKALSWNADTPSGGYIAVALQRSQIQHNKTITLGNEKETECNVLSAPSASVTTRRRRSLAPNNTIKGKAAALEYDGIKYKMLTVTATPIATKLVKLQKSMEVTFTQGYTSSSTLIIVVVSVGVVLIVILGIILIVCYKRYKLEKSKSGQDQTVNVNEAFLGISGMDTSKTEIPFQDLKREFLVMSANESAQFVQQYTELKRIAKETAPFITMAKSPEAMKKNRYKNILPYDNTRVPLKGDGMNSYINACYVQGPGKRFIAAQGPMPNTTVDFWRMIVEQKCQIIVMLTNCEENGRVKCEKYWPSAGSCINFGTNRIGNTGETECGGIIKRALRVETQDKSTTEVIQFHFVRWPDHGVPSTTSTFLRLHKHVMEHYKSSTQKGPILVHCSAGVGRTGTFIGFDILNDEEDNNSVNIYQRVLEMRQQRVDMVQTCTQYEMLHKLMLEKYLFKGTNFISTELPAKIRGTAFIREFKYLADAESFTSQSKEKSSDDASKVVIVRQPEDTEWVRINATRVEAYSENMKFIASEGPTNSTVEYFLRAIWDNDVDVIVMLNNPDADTEDSQYANYWPSQSNRPLAFTNITVEVTNEVVVRGAVERTLRLTFRNHEQKNILQYQFLEWTSVLPSENGDGILDLINRVDAIQQDKPATVMVHCKDGLGKTGVFIAVANLTKRLEAENQVDVFRAVKDLRDIRPGMVTTLTEYKLCFDILHLFTSQKNVYVNEEVVAQEPAVDPIYQNL